MCVLAVNLPAAERETFLALAGIGNQRVGGVAEQVPAPRPQTPPGWGCPCQFSCLFSFKLFGALLLGLALPPRLDPPSSCVHPLHPLHPPPVQVSTMADQLAALCAHVLPGGSNAPILAAVPALAETRAASRAAVAAGAAPGTPPLPSAASQTAAALSPARALPHTLPATPARDFAEADASVAAPLPRHRSGATTRSTCVPRGAPAIRSRFSTRIAQPSALSWRLAIFESFTLLVAHLIALSLIFRTSASTSS